MTTEIELLPLPVGEASSFGNYDVHDNETMVAYARANVARAVAPLQAEIERLQAEVERLRADLDSWEQQASDRVADWYAEHLRAERLEEALKKVTQALEWYAHGRCRGFDDAAPLSTAEAVKLAERTLAKARA